MRDSIRCSIVRGGTSKGIFLFEEDLPSPGVKRDAIIKGIMGTPDLRQIDGLGGADILTSKVAIIGPPSRDDADVDYTFAQVGIEQDLVRYDGNCGNISAAVGPFAIESGFVTAKAPVTQVRIHNTNINKIIHAEVPVMAGRPSETGEYHIDGVPGTGAKIMLDFSETIGSLTGKLLPAGQPKDIMEIEGFGNIEVSIVDLANPVVFVRADAIGCKGSDHPSVLDSDSKLLETFEEIRSKAAERLGFVSDWKRAFDLSPYVPFFVFVAPVSSYERYGDKKIIMQNEIDIIARLVGFKKTHKAFPGTGGACLAAASRIPGTVVSEVMSASSRKGEILRVGHPSGIMELEVESDSNGNPLRAAYGSTWRRIMDGHAFIPERISYKENKEEKIIC